MSSAYYPFQVSKNLMVLRFTIPRREKSNISLILVGRLRSSKLIMWLLNDQWPTRWRSSLTINICGKSALGAKTLWFILLLLLVKYLVDVEFLKQLMFTPKSIPDELQLRIDTIKVNSFLSQLNETKYANEKREPNIIQQWCNFCAYVFFGQYFGCSQRV